MLSLWTLDPELMEMPCLQPGLWCLKNGKVGSSNTTLYLAFPIGSFLLSTQIFVMAIQRHLALPPPSQFCL